MITPMQMYWLVTLDGIVAMFTVFTVMGIIFVIAWMCYISETGNSDAKWFPLTSIVFAALSLVAAVFVPTTKQMAAIIIVPKIANSEKVQTVGNKLYDLAVEWMDELKPARAKEGGAK